MAKNDEILKKLKDSILEFDEEKAVEAAKESVAAGLDPVLAVNALGDGLNILGDKFQLMEVFLPEIVLASDAMKEAMKILEPEIKKSATTMDKRHAVVIGTVRGDVHQVGKDMVATMLLTAGFDVKDLGVDVAPSVFLEEAKGLEATIIAASALMTTTLPVQKDLIDFLEAKGLRKNFKVMVGGGVATRQWAEQIGSDGYGQDAVEAIDVAKKLCK